jgi:hypothetical protein
MSGVKPKVSKLLRRHLNGESDGKEEVAPIVGAGWKDIWSHGASPRGSNILRTVQGTQETVVTAFKWLVGARRLWVTRPQALQMGGLRDRRQQ